jgi:hypothetical protein
MDKIKKKNLPFTFTSVPTPKKDWSFTSRGKPQHSSLSFA